MLAFKSFIKSDLNPHILISLDVEFRWNLGAMNTARFNNSANNVARESEFKSSGGINDHKVPLDEFKNKIISDIEEVKSRYMNELNSVSNNEEKQNVKEKYSSALLDITATLEKVQKSIESS